MHWKSPQFHRKKKTHEQVEIQSNDDFLDIRWVIHIDWILEDQTVNQDYYKYALKTLRGRVQRRPDLWKMTQDL